MNTDYMGSIHDPINEQMRASYAQWVHEQAARSDCGWVSVTEVELTTGLSTLIAYKANPIMERKELNKEAKIKRVSSKGIMNEWAYVPSIAQFSAAPIPPSLLAVLNAQQSEQDEEEDEHPEAVLSTSTNQW
jgi:hypothetical protein